VLRTETILYRGVRWRLTEKIQPRLRPLPSTTGWERSRPICQRRLVMYPGTTCRRAVPLGGRNSLELPRPLRPSGPTVRSGQRERKFFRCIETNAAVRLAPIGISEECTASRFYRLRARSMIGSHFIKTRCALFHCLRCPHCGWSEIASLKERKAISGGVKPLGLVFAAGRQV